MKMNLPNKLSILRLIMAFILALILLFPFYSINFELPKIIVNDLLILDSRYLIAGVIFILAALTDMIDGRIARKNNIVTDFGKFIDAIADKVLVNTALIILAAQGFISVAIPVIIIVRDTIVDSIRMLAANKGNVIAAGKVGKIKTLVMMVGLSLTFAYNLPFELWNVDVANGLLIIAVVLSVYSGLEYYFLNKNNLF